MSLDIEKARAIERTVTIKGSAKGLPARDFIVRVGARGITVRRKGEANERDMSITWRQLIGILLVHLG